MNLTMEQLQELKRVIERVEHPTETLQEVLDQVEIALFQETIQPGDWFRSLETDGIYEAFEVNREEGKVWFFDPFDQRDTWMRLDEIAPATKEEIEEAKRIQEEMNHRYKERCQLIEEYLKKKHPGGTFIPVESLQGEGFPLWIEIDGKVLGRYVWSGWPNSYHYTVCMTD